MTGSSSGGTTVIKGTSSFLNGLQYLSLDCVSEKVESCLLIISSPNTEALFLLIPEGTVSDVSEVRDCVRMYKALSLFVVSMM